MFSFFSFTISLSFCFSLSLTLSLSLSLSLDSSIYRAWNETCSNGPTLPPSHHHNYILSWGEQPKSLTDYLWQKLHHLPSTLWFIQKNPGPILCHTDPDSWLGVWTIELCLCNGGLDPNTLASASAARINRSWDWVALRGISEYDASHWRNSQKEFIDLIFPLFHFIH